MEREKFDTGAVRDVQSDKTRPDLISPHLLERLGWWLAVKGDPTKGGYGYRNWEKGMPVSRCLASLMRHVVAILKGEVHQPKPNELTTTDDHVAAAMFNLMQIAHYQAEVKAGRMNVDMLDFPQGLLDEYKFWEWFDGQHPQDEAPASGTKSESPPKTARPVGNSLPGKDGRCTNPKCLLCQPLLGMGDGKSTVLETLLKGVFG